MNISQVPTVVDSERGCGWRKPGGLYLRSDGPMKECGKLPVPLDVCPCCHAGIKPARGWTWFDPRPFVNAKPCAFSLTPGDERALECLVCPLAGGAPDKAGLLWVGEKFYPTPQAYMDEARKLGLSRRINRVPQGYKPGDRVYLAHRLAIKHPCDCQPATDKPVSHGEDCKSLKPTAAIFTTFVPERIEYVCKGTETEAELDALTERGITPVKVVRDIDQQPSQSPSPGDVKP